MVYPGSLEATAGLFWRLLGLFWGITGLFWGILGLFWTNLSLLDLFSGNFGPFLEDFGSIWGAWRAYLGNFRA